ncbi:MAG: hypothetical protein NTX79_06835 [Candidatus Micrarchaeota archaeon]|nr:hypothetical protein [Candidatus Micrarchaeota archaeon]
MTARDNECRASRTASKEGAGHGAKGNEFMASRAGGKGRVGT